MSYFGSVAIKDGPNLAPFSGLRVVQPTTLFDSQMQYDTNPLLWETTLAGSGSATHLPNESSVRLRTTTASGDSVIRQTKAYFRYQPGKGQMILTTFRTAVPAANVRQRIGYFDAQNGIFLELDGTTINIVRRTYTSGSAVDNKVAQASWNLDKLDGTGPSAITLDWTKTQILIIDFQWLGVGRVRVGFDIDGKIYYAHEFRNANNLTLVYMTTPNLPVRYEITNSGTASSSTNDLIQICTSVISEGGVELGRGYPFSANNGITAIGVTTRRAVLSIRPAATFNSIVNRSLILPQGFEFYVTTNAMLWEVVYNGTLGGSPSWAAANASSAVEFDVAGTTVTGGITIASGYVPAAAATRTAVSQKIESRLPLVLDAAGANPINLSLVATSFTGTSNVAAEIDWVEYR